MPPFRSKEEKITEKEFFDAIGKGELGTVQKYVEAHKNQLATVLNKPDKNGNLPLFIAAMSAREPTEVVQYLIEHGADYTKKQGEKTLEDSARFNQNHKIVSYLQQIQSNPDAIKEQVMKNLEGTGTVTDKDPTLREALKNYSFTTQSKPKARDKENFRRLIKLEGDPDPDQKQDQENTPPTPKTG